MFDHVCHAQIFVGAMGSSWPTDVIISHAAAASSPVNAAKNVDWLSHAPSLRGHGWTSAEQRELQHAELLGHGAPIWAMELAASGRSWSKMEKRRHARAHRNTEVQRKAQHVSFREPLSDMAMARQRSPTFKCDCLCGPPWANPGLSPKHL